MVNTTITRKQSLPRNFRVNIHKYWTPKRFFLEKTHFIMVGGLQAHYKFGLTPPRFWHLHSLGNSDHINSGYIRLRRNISEKVGEKLTFQKATPFENLHVSKPTNKVRVKLKPRPRRTRRRTSAKLYTTHRLKLTLSSMFTGSFWRKPRLFPRTKRPKSKIYAWKSYQNRSFMSSFITTLEARSVYTKKCLLKRAWRSARSRSKRVLRRFRNRPSSRPSGRLSYAGSKLNNALSERLNKPSPSQLRSCWSGCGTDYVSITAKSHVNLEPNRSFEPLLIYSTPTHRYSALRQVVDSSESVWKHKYLTVTHRRTMDVSAKHRICRQSNPLSLVIKLDRVSPQIARTPTHTLRVLKKLRWSKRVTRGFCELQKHQLTSYLSSSVFEQQNTPSFINSMRWGFLAKTSYISQQPIVITKRKTNFTLRLGGIFFAFKALKAGSIRPRFLHRIKKRYFSFLAPNQVKRTIMLQKKKIILSKLVLNVRGLLKKKRRFSYAFFRSTYINNTKKTLRSRVLSSSSLQVADILAPYTKASNFELTHLFTPTGDEIVDRPALINQGDSLLKDRGEVRISRIKFKPGYQRIWRRVRTALKDSLRLRFIYQQQLTKYLTRFYYTAKTYAATPTEFSFDKVTVYSRLLPDLNTFRVFLRKGLISINGNTAFAPEGFTAPGDLIQLTVSVWYYVLYRWVFNWTNQRVRKFRRMVYRKGLASRYRVMKLRKQRSHYTPCWIYNNRFDISDVKPYLEVDYFSLSAVVLYDPYITDQHTPNDRADVRVNIYRLYNWKYIN